MLLSQINCFVSPLPKKCAVFGLSSLLLLDFFFVEFSSTDPHRSAFPSLHSVVAFLVLEVNAERKRTEIGGSFHSA